LALNVIPSGYWVFDRNNDHGSCEVIKRGKRKRGKAQKERKVARALCFSKAQWVIINPGETGIEGKQKQYG